MAWSTFKTWLFRHKHNEQKANGANKHVNDHIMGVNDGQDYDPLYIDGANKLKHYAFEGVVDGYKFSIPVNAVGLTGDPPAGVGVLNYIFVAYKETPDPAFAGSVLSVAFDLVVTSVFALPAGYDGAMLIAQATWTDPNWAGLTSYNMPIQPVFHRDEIFWDEDDNLAFPMADQTWEGVNLLAGPAAGLGWTLPLNIDAVTPACLGAYMKVDACVTISRMTPNAATGIVGLRIKYNGVTIGAEMFDQQVDSWLVNLSATGEFRHTSGNNVLIVEVYSDQAVGGGFADELWNYAVTVVASPIGQQLVDVLPA